MGWNGSDNRTKTQQSPDETIPHHPRRLRLFITTFVALAIGLLVAIYVACDDTNSAIGTRNDTVSAVVSNKSTLIKEIGQVSRTTCLSDKQKPHTIQEAFSNLQEVSTPTPLNRIAKPIDLKSFPKPIYNSGAEQLLVSIFSAEVGEMPPPIPDLDEEDAKNIVSILVSDNPIKNDDSEFVAESKEVLRAAKKEMMSYLHNGGDPNDFIRHYCDELQRMCDYRDEAMAQYGLLCEEDPVIAKEFVDKINEKFEKDGIKPIEMPPIE